MKALESRAGACADIAYAAMEHPDSIQITKSYVEELAGGLSVELRTTAKSGWKPNYLHSEDDVSTNRYLYLLNKGFLSLDIDSVVSGRSEGEISNPQLLRIAENGTRSTELKRLFALANAAVEGTLTDDRIIELNGLFMTISERAIVDTYCFRTFDFDDTSKLAITKHDDGSGLYTPSPLGPPLSIELTVPTSEQKTVLQRLPNNTYETFEEPNDELSHIAKYPEEKDIFRDEDGRIIGVNVAPAKVEVLVEAERTLGLRQLSHRYLSRIEDAMEKVKVIVRSEQ